MFASGYFVYKNIEKVSKLLELLKVVIMLTKRIITQ